MFGREGVVVLRRLPAVDHEIPPGQLGVAEELGADVAAAAAEELRPVAVGAVHPFEGVGVAHLVAENQGDHPAIPIKRGR